MTFEGPFDYWSNYINSVGYVVCKHYSENFKLVDAVITIQQLNILSAMDRRLAAVCSS